MVLSIICIDSVAADSIFAAIDYPSPKRNTSNNHETACYHVFLRLVWVQATIQRFVTITLRNYERNRNLNYERNRNCGSICCLVVVTISILLPARFYKKFNRSFVSTNSTLLINQPSSRITSTSSISIVQVTATKHQLSSLSSSSSAVTVIKTKTVLSDLNRRKFDFSKKEEMYLQKYDDEKNNSNNEVLSSSEVSSSPTLLSSSHAGDDIETDDAIQMLPIQLPFGIRIMLE